MRISDWSSDVCSSDLFLGTDFISVSKADEQNWQVLKPSVLGAIMEHFTARRPMLLEGDAADEAGSYDAADSEVVAQIKELLDTPVRPAVAQDGGALVFRGFDQGAAHLHMQGSCAGCPSSSAHLRLGLDNKHQNYVP